MESNAVKSWMSPKRVVLSLSAVVGIGILLLLYHQITWGMLVKAIVRGDASTVGTLVRLNPALVRCEDWAGDTALALATERDDVDIVRTLIRAGSDMNHDTGRIGNSPNYAAFFASAATVQCFVDAGYDVNRQVNSMNNSGTVLYHASTGGNAEVVRLLIQHGVVVNQANLDDGLTPLMGAMFPSHNARDRKGRVETVRLLLDAGAKRELQSKDHKTALDYLQVQLGILPHSSSREVDENTSDEYRDTYLPLKEVEQLMMQPHP
jgi:ankyrin repeat protein